MGLEDCKGLVQGEDIMPEPNAGDADVSSSQAMINHNLLKASRDGDLGGMMSAIKGGAYVETRRPFVMMTESCLPNSRLAIAEDRGVGMTPLMYAAQAGYAEACSLLLSKGASVNAEDEDGLKPLHFAASSGCPQTCSVLLQRGADAAALDDEGFTALDYVPASYASNEADRRQWEQLLATRARPASPGLSGPALSAADPD